MNKRVYLLPFTVLFTIMLILPTRGYSWAEEPTSFCKTAYDAYMKYLDDGIIEYKFEGYTVSFGSMETNNQEDECGFCIFNNPNVPAFITHISHPQQLPITIYNYGTCLLTEELDTIKIGADGEDMPLTIFTRKERVILNDFYKNILSGALDGFKQEKSQSHNNFKKRIMDFINLQK